MDNAASSPASGASPVDPGTPTDCQGDAVRLHRFENSDKTGSPCERLLTRSPRLSAIDWEPLDGKAAPAKRLFAASPIELLRPRVCARPRFTSDKAFHNHDGARDDPGEAYRLEAALAGIPSS